MKLSIKEILKATQGKLLKGENLSYKLSVSSDTRTISAENIFLPLKGENFDGHNFINNAIQKNCNGYFIENNRIPENKSVEFIISVENTLDAYLKIAHYVRQKINPVVIAITGSSGKTTTKEFIYSVLSTSFKAHKSKLNHNNEIGFCQTILNMPEDTEYAVIEMGMRGLGEIELLSEHAEPDIAVITNIGTAHIGRLGSIENIAKAKCEITSYLKNTGSLISFEDNLIKKHCNWHGKKIFYGREYEITLQKENLTGFIYKDEYYEIPVMGEYNVINSLAAIEVGKYAGIIYENIKKGLMNYLHVGDRGKVINLKHNIKLIVDCYNANPDSMKASINSVINTYKNAKITLVLGDMGELGEHEEQLHREVGVFVSGKRVNTLITVGRKAKFIAETAGNYDLHIKPFLNNAEAVEFLKNNLEENSVILLKASRSMKFEEIVQSLQTKI